MARTQMAREEILRRSLLRAYPEHEEVLRDGTLSTTPHHYIPLIYSRHFARAFWGEDWEEHHWQLLWHKRGPLAYLARFL
jgi:hypothetical protein